MKRNIEKVINSATVPSCFDLKYSEINTIRAMADNNSNMMIMYAFQAGYMIGKNNRIKNTCKNLKQLRGNRTQEEVAQAVSVSTSSYIAYENGERAPRDAVKIRLSNYYNVPINEL